MNIFLSITASLGNALILIALHKVSSVHPPTKLLFRCLAVTDLCVGLISQPLIVIRVLTIYAPSITMNSSTLYYVREVNRSVSFALCRTSALTSTAISMERFIALKMGLRYRQVVSLRRVRAAITCFCLIGISVGLMNWFWNVRIAYMAAIIVVLLSVFISVFFYTMIYLRLQQHQAQVEHVHQGQPNRKRNPLIISQYKKTVYSIAWVQLAMVVCYVPFIISAVIVKMKGWRGVSVDFVWLSAVTLFYSNSSLNPILYCWKISEVRQAVKDTVKQWRCSSS